MKTLILVLVVLVVVIVTVWALSDRKEEFTDSPVKDKFVSMYQPYFSKVTSCVMTDIYAYPYSEAELLVTEEQFKNNPTIKGLLEKCEYSKIRSLYNLYATMSQMLKCGVSVDDFSKWFLDTVPVKILTSEEEEAYKKTFKVFLTDKCWTAEVKDREFTKTKDRSVQLVREMFKDKTALAGAFISEKRYDDWLNYISRIALEKVISEGVLPDDYTPDKMTQTDFDKLSINGMKKIAGHVSVALLVFGDGTVTTCSVEKIVKTMVILDIPFETNIIPLKYVPQVLQKCASV